MTAAIPPITVPGDKSIAHRALILAALAHGESVLRNVPAGLDVRSTRRALSALGVTFGDEGGTLRVTGSGGVLVGPADAIDCGNSGTTIRLLAGVVATRALDVTLDGDESLRKRPMRRIAEPLAVFGADFDLSPTGTAPMRVRGNQFAAGVDIALTVPSAQVKSAILLAALGARGVTRVGGAIATRDHTERLLRAFGVACAHEGPALLIEGPAALQATEIDVPGDMSSAAFLLAAAAAVPGAAVVVDDVGLNPTRTAFLDVLRRFGADVSVEAGDAGPEPRGRVTVRGAPLRAVAISPDDVPGLIDELPLVGVLGAFARGTTVVSGASELRVKESDRIATFAAAARALGIEVDTFDDGFMVHGPARFHGGTVVTGGDHRIAMAFAVAARAAAVDVVLDDPDCVAVSFPGFSHALDAVA
jgi:3-phosphoshikimate 1-carboxyvinyltransferase